MANSDNPRRGAEFEVVALNLFSDLGYQLSRNLQVEIGISSLRKPHAFDLGSLQEKLLVECKFHTWTAGGNSPSAKMSVWNEAMYYFLAAPSDFRKILFTLKSERNGETLVHHYVKRYEHLIPDGVEIWEYDSGSKSAMCQYPKAGG